MHFTNKVNKLIKKLENKKVVVTGASKGIGAGIAKQMATTVTLSNGIPIETVSKMLGHSSIKQTQHYAKILDRKVIDDMKILREKFSLKRELENKVIISV